MSALHDVGIAEVTVLTAALLTGAGWLITRFVSRGDERTRQDASQDHTMTLLRRDVDDYGKRLERVERRGEGHSQELGALGLLFERHERWHERNDPPAG